jgi:predicted amidohydrolase YtcJ
MAGFSADGWLTQDAHHAVRKVALESVTVDQRREAQHRCLERAASLGIGSIHELGGPDISGPEDFVDLLTNVAPDSGVDVVGYWGEGGGPSAAGSLGAKGAAGDHFVDGAIGSRTAFLTAPYADADTNGAVYTNAAAIRDHVVACSAAGVQAGYHVIGDAAMELVVAGFNEAAELVGAAAVRSARHRLEHVEMVDGPALHMLTNLGVVASVQPVFDAWWGGETAMYAERLGVDRASMLNPLASMLSAGVPLAFGSDAPVTPLGPWAAIRAAATHHQPEQRLPVRAAFSAHTRGGWRAAGEMTGGTIAVGAAASVAVWECGDLIVETPETRVAAWSTDPRAGVPGLPALGEDDPDPVCLKTLVRGRGVFDRVSLTEQERER